MEIDANFPQRFFPLELEFERKYLQEMGKTIHIRHPKPVFSGEDSAQIFR
jgi:hypothetical protein